MEKYSYFREQYNMITQFVAAFDNCFLWRYDNEGSPKEKIGVRYIVGSKQRALFDIANPSKNITLPAISINRKNIRRDPSRIQNKDSHIYRPHTKDKNISKIPQPIPVLMDVDVSIISTYKEDIDQIVSNFIPWCNPYFIISLQIPEEFGLDFVDEIRSDVSWSGSVDYEEPIEVSSEDKHRIIANTSFTIKGWIFSAIEPHVAPIYVVRGDFNVVGTGESLNGDYYGKLSAVDYSNTDVILISAYPEITNEFINGRPYYTPISINSENEYSITLFGKRFNFENKWYLSSNQIMSNMPYEEINTFKFPKISAYRLSDDLVTVVNDNIANITLSSDFLSSGNFTIVTSNSAGWVSSNYNILVI